jgi:ribonuclease HII
LVDPPAADPLDAWARGHGYRFVAGVDEVGRGPLAGPVVAAAVLLGCDHGIEGLADSKQLSEVRRVTLARQISQRAVGVGLGVIGPERIDQTDIRRASLEAMGVALSELLAQQVIPDLVMVDGRDVFTLPAGAPAMRVKAFVKGDQRSQVIGAASIVAKVYRDALMQEYHAIWPEYGFDRHKGYPTAAHRGALVRLGPCEIHRRSFRGVLPASDQTQPAGRSQYTS